MFLCPGILVSRCLHGNATLFSCERRSDSSRHVELTVDRPQETWPRHADSILKMGGRRSLDINSLLAVLEQEES